jgi:protein-tyrosine phosphatase
MISNRFRARLQFARLPLCLALLALGGPAGVAAPSAEPAIVTAATLEATVERIDAERVRVSWSPGEPVDIFVADWPDGSPVRARRLAQGGTIGHVEVEAPAERRLYFRLHGTRSGRMLTTAERLLPLQAGSNFRDLGGYRTVDGRRVRWGRIYRSGATPLLTAQDVAYVRALGVRSLVDLRSVDESALAPTRLAFPGMRYFTQDYSWEQMLAAGQAAGGLPMSGLYRSWTTLLAPQFRTLFRQLLTSTNAIAFSCTAGQDRTGVAAALVLTVLGVPRTTILDDYHLSTPSRRPHYEIAEIDPAAFPGNPVAAGAARARSTPPNPLYHPSGRAFLEDFLDEVDQRWGSVEHYLAEELGVSAANQERLRALYLE